MRVFTVLVILVVIIGNSYVSAVAGTFCKLYKPDSKGHVDIPNKWYLKSIPATAFMGCSNLKTINIPDNIKSIGWGAFQGCTNLQEVQGAKKVTSIGEGAFVGCVDLIAFNVPAGVRTLEELLFQGATALRTVTFAPGSMLSEIKLGVFLGCQSLETITLPRLVTDLPKLVFAGLYNLKTIEFAEGSQLTEIGSGAFIGCVNVTSLQIPAGVKKLPAFAFAGLYNLKVVSFAEDSKLTTFGYFTFQGCSNLETISIPASVESIQFGAFYRLASLQEVNIPSDSRLETIGKAAFFGCSNLVQVNFGANSKLTKLGELAFARCTSLVSIRFPIGVNILHGSVLGSTYSLRELIFDSVNVTAHHEALTGTRLTPSGIYFRNDVEMVNMNSSMQYFHDVFYQNSTFISCQPRYGNYRNRLSDTHFRCLGCPSGKSKDEVSRKSCSDCSIGTYTNFTRSPRCYESPAGTYVNETGATTFKSCELGRFATWTGSNGSLPCPPGSYADKVGHAICKLCPAGKYSIEVEASSIDVCRDCPPGMYSSNAGASVCEKCSAVEIQPLSGQTMCLECGGNIPDSDNNRTTCVERRRSQINSAGDLDEVVGEFLDNAAIPVAVCTGIIFMLLGALVTYLREQEPTRLSNYTRSEALYNSFVAGFSFGADIFVIFSVFTAGAPGYGVPMLLFRMLHVFGAGALCFSLFGSLDTVESWDGASSYFGHISSLRDTLENAYVTEYLWLVEIIALFGFADISMMQFLPWNKTVSRFYTLSLGYPSLRIMKFCLNLKTIQVCFTVFCETLFLVSTSAGNLSPVQHTLFILSIISSIIIFLVDVFILCMRGEVLRGVELDYKEKGKVDQTKEKPKRASDIVIADVYGGGEEDDADGKIDLVINPMRLSNIEADNCFGDSTTNSSPKLEVTKPSALEPESDAQVDHQL